MRGPAEEEGVQVLLEGFLPHKLARGAAGLPAPLAPLEKVEKASVALPGEAFEQYPPVQVGSPKTRSGGDSLGGEDLE